MGNCPCLGALRPNRGNSEGAKIVRIVKTDGKILEYKSSVLVRHLTPNFDRCGVGLTPNDSRPHPPDYELKAGHLHHLLPSVSPVGGTEDGVAGGIKRIKIVISKQQLQELINRKISMEEVLSSLRRSVADVADSVSSTWKPKLETIPEGSEFSGR